MAASDPPGGKTLSKGDVLAGARLTEPMARGERISAWRAQRSDGEPATVHALSGAKREREKDNFLKGARRLAVLTRNRPLPGVVNIVTVVPNVPAYVAAGGTAGTMEDVSILGWGVRETVRFIRRLCRALRSLHDSGIAHGCLRPANVLLDDDLNPRLSDVGMLIIDDSYDGPSDMMHDYAPYAAREVRLGKKADVRSDIFSVGRLLYFALHGEVPPLVDDDNPILPELEHAPPGLVRIIRRCTLRAPEGRYRSVNELLRDLENWRDAENVGVKHPHGKEGVREDSSLPGDSEPPSYPDRPSSRPQDSAASSVQSGGGGPTTGERQAPEVPIRSYHAPPVEEDDVLTPLQARVGAAVGALLLSGALLHAYYNGVTSSIALAGTVVGAILLSLVFPPVGPPFLSRLLAAIVFGVAVWYVDPATVLAERGRITRLSSGSPAQRGIELAKLRARGVRAFDGLDLRGVDFQKLNLAFTSFRGSQLSRAQFDGAALQGVDFSEADIGEADFSGADLGGSNVSLSKGWQTAICSDTTTMPEGWICDEGLPFPATTVREVYPEPLEPEEE
jgi:serine/threonine-protein kinase